MNRQRRQRLSAIEGSLEIIDAEHMELTGIQKIVKDVKDRLENVLADEQEAYDNLLPSLQEGDRGETMQGAIEAMTEAEAQLKIVADAKDDEDEAWRLVVDEAIDEAIAKVQEAQG